MIYGKGSHILHYHEPVNDAMYLCKQLSCYKASSKKAKQDTKYANAERGEQVNHKSLQAQQLHLHNFSHQHSTLDETIFQYRFFGATSLIEPNIALKLLNHVTKKNAFVQSN